jgi:hypothetical protein
VVKSLALFAAFLLAGCAAAGNWTKPGADATATAAAYRECRGMADTAVEPEVGINEDILATRQGDWQRSRIGEVESNAMQDHTRDRAASIIDACMQAEGFTRAPGK